MEVNLSITTSGLKDASKPDGEACNDDGTLKEASEMDWPDSPTDLAAPATLKRRAHSDDESGGDGEDEKDEEDLDIDGNDDPEDVGHKRTKRQRVSE